MANKLTYEDGYREGESSVTADIIIAFDIIAGLEVEGVFDAASKYAALEAKLKDAEERNALLLSEYNIQAADLTAARADLQEVQLRQDEEFTRVYTDFRNAQRDLYDVAQAMGIPPDYATKAEMLRWALPHMSVLAGEIANLRDSERNLKTILQEVQAERDDLLRIIPRTMGDVFQLLHDLRQWDHLDGAGDGPYWKNRIDEALRAKAP